MNSTRSSSTDKGLIRHSDDSLLETWLYSALERGYIPEWLIRIGIRRQLRDRLYQIHTNSLSEAYEAKMRLIATLRASQMAIAMDIANVQHYEVDPQFFVSCLGARMKYSCCLYDSSRSAKSSRQITLDQAELAMLDLYVDRAEIHDGMTILDLGCGWGSASIYLAERFPTCQITAFSNSSSQKAFIEATCHAHKLTNVTCVIGDIVHYEFPCSMPLYDRVVSIEMFEHMKNYDLLLSKISRLLKPGGKLFVHIFAHRDTPYNFDVNDGWMSQHFFTGGIMPSADLLLYFQRDLRVARQWWINGLHYSRTCEDWLRNMKANESLSWPSLVKTYSKSCKSEEPDPSNHNENSLSQDKLTALIWWNRWKIFFMACSELFRYNNGDTWGIAQYLFIKPQ